MFLEICADELKLCSSDGTLVIASVCVHMRVCVSVCVCVCVCVGVLVSVMILLTYRDRNVQ